jgi:hypothetical protein
MLRDANGHLPQTPVAQFKAIFLTENTFRAHMPALTPLNARRSNFAFYSENEMKVPMGDFTNYDLELWILMRLTGVFKLTFLNCQFSIFAAHSLVLDHEFAICEFIV